MSYEHTQKSPLGWILFVIGILILLSSLWASNQTRVLMLVVAVVLFFTSFCFSRLTIRDEINFLSLRFGPIPLFHTRVLYSEITDVQEDRSNLLDGWGIHYIPGRGITFNVWGFDCVRILKGKKVVRIGTDDKAALAGFLRTRIRKSSNG